MPYFDLTLQKPEMSYYDLQLATTTAGKDGSNRQQTKQQAQDNNSNNKELIRYRISTPRTPNN